MSGSHPNKHSKDHNHGHGSGGNQDARGRTQEATEAKVVSGPKVVHRGDSPLRNPNRGEAEPPTAQQVEDAGRQAERQRVADKKKHHCGGGQQHQGGGGSPQHGKGDAHHKGAGGHSSQRGKGNHGGAGAARPGAEALQAPLTATPPVEDRVLIPYHAGARSNIEDGMRKGTIVVGVLKLIKWSMGIAWVRCPGLGVDVEVHTVDARNGALPGDVVAVELADTSTWDNYVPKNSADGGADGDADGGGRMRINARLKDPSVPKATLPDGREVMHIVDESALLQDKQARPREVHLDPVSNIYQLVGVSPPVDKLPEGKKPRGKIVAVMEQRFTLLHPSRLVDSVQGRINPTRYYKFRSYDPTFPYIAVYGRDIPAELHDKLGDVLPLIRVMVDNTGAPESWIEKGHFPRGQVLMSLGMGGTTEAETRALAASNNIKDAEFTDEVNACVFPEFSVPPTDKLKEMGRRDLRNEEFVCTIDPATARDLDDAISITKTSGGYRVGVHIADVSFFVPLNSALDMEARDRCTSTYFVERVIPMLPRKLCEEYCSLEAGDDKFAFSCIFHMDNNANITSEWFGQSVIRNSCRMAYEDAQTIIDGDTSGDCLNIHPSELAAEGPSTQRADIVKRVVKSVQMMYDVASMMRKRRFEDGALSLNKSKLKFQFDDINSRVAPIGFDLEKTREANWMVEQFMLLANIRVAQKIVEFLPQCALLRKHDAPDKRKLRAFKDAAAKHGFKVSINGSKGLNDSLAKYKDDPCNDALRLMATYCMMLAKYISSGEDETEAVEHYALATPCYTHFTSPIRRYADLMVHRQLLVALELEQIVKRNAANGNAEAPIDVSKLANRAYYFTHFEVSEIASKCNLQKERARKCSDGSMKLFFCFFLEALRLRSKVDPSISPVQRTPVEVVRLRDGSFSVFAIEISSDCEIHMNARTQKWKSDCRFNKTENTFVIHWGPGPDGDEDIEEEVGLFFKCTAELCVTHENGLMKLDMIIEPPWKRSAASVQREIPKVL